MESPYIPGTLEYAYVYKTQFSLLQFVTKSFCFIDTFWFMFAKHFCEQKNVSPKKKLVLYYTPTS